MPFKSEKEVADKIKGADKLSPRKRRQFMHVFNKCFEEKGDDSSCYAQAWGAVRKTACISCEIRTKVASELDSIAASLSDVAPVLAENIKQEVRILKGV